jgi:hypothetical protein
MIKSKLQYLLILIIRSKDEVILNIPYYRKCIILNVSVKINKYKRKSFLNVKTTLIFTQGYIYIYICMYKYYFYFENILLV